MKKLWMIVLTAVLLLGTAGCGKEEKPSPAPEASAKPEISEPINSDTHGEEKRIIGKISDIKNVMFILDDGRDAYVFPLEEGTTLEGIQDGDQVQVTYTGELSLTGDSELNTVKVEKIK
ncbi:hypothetical protein [Holdemania massiliensis]|uniref:DUF1344 domain-containing protein n=1 Tax=Holdemania massiliensis TaxID=1468449 RepID=A0A6N7S8V3_9FIRM|nr:hypothetical protein [Holdemania massiliensis]MSA71770.1 hypothetical protein [Holdemania massiliensis]MSA90045.1 hypothetical protein [Holdemania massiliensis]MSB78779.1 hypothetical protein [Holdemania massiliensis]MSC33775.1 hypothetical protein [Holdemania massiliensis]MSC40165.1 hypothetical protein [Holdemania massiliensis]